VIVVPAGPYLNGVIMAPVDAFKQRLSIGLTIFPVVDEKRYGIIFI
jgi:hypothetical protein